MCCTEPIVGQRLAGQVPSQTSSAAIGSDVVFMRKQVCPAEKDHCGSARGTAGGSGSVTQGGIQVVSFQLRVHYMIVSVALMSFDLGSLCWLTFNKESTDCGKTSWLS